MIADFKNFKRLRKGSCRVFVVLSLVLFIFIMLRHALMDAAGILFGASIISFLISPLMHIYERWLSRPPAALCALLSIFVITTAVLGLLLPSLIIEANAVIQTLPDSLAQIKSWISKAAGWLNGYFPDIKFSVPSLGEDRLPAIARSTVSFAGSVAGIFYRLSLMIVLGYFFLCDSKRLLLRAELFVPCRIRQTVVQMGMAVCRELKTYLRGQGLISLAVGMLSATGLGLVGVHSALVLGLMVGLMNMIPYFGPVIGAIPAVLMALNGGWKTALYAVIVLWLVQQLDSTLISPRIMSSVSGVSPAVVLLAVFIGSALNGIIGMLLAMPVVMSFRTVFRVFVQRHENV